MKSSSYWRNVIIVLSVLAMLWVPAVRLGGPSDTYTKNQPLTMAYTTDMVVYGEWLLPRAEEDEKATKPLLYNWLAAPFVRAFGASSEAAHTMPSIIAFVLCWALIVVVGQRLGNVQTSERPNLEIFTGEQLTDSPSHSLLGWTAGLMFCTTYPIVSLAGLARTDMLLTWWIVLGWVLATALVVQGSDGATERRRDEVGRWSFSPLSLCLGFWICVAMALLTKGPPAIVLLVYAAIAPRLLLGTWRLRHGFHWWWGLPASFLPFAAWVGAVWVIDPEHLINQLWGEELVGRVLGTGDEGSREGPIDLLRTVGHMPLYYTVRFLPWSVLSILGMIELWKWRKTYNGQGTGEGEQGTGDRVERDVPSLNVWMIGAALFMLVMIVVFSHSAGKRAAYIAPAFGPGALLAAWWIFTPLKELGYRASFAQRWPWFAPLAAIVICVVISMHLLRDARAPSPGFGSEIRSFIVAVDKRIQTDDAPVFMWHFENVQLRAMLSVPVRRDDEALLEALEREGRAWVLALPRDDLAGWIESHVPAAQVEQLIRAPHLPSPLRWPEDLALYRVER